MEIGRGHTAVIIALMSLLWGAASASAQSASVAAATGAASDKISAVDAYQAVKSGQTLLIDTREAYEKQSGSPAGVGAEVTYHMNGSGDAAFVRSVLKLADGKQDADIILICQAGVRSAAAEKVLESNGFTKVRTVVGGYNRWREQQLPSQPK